MKKLPVGIVKFEDFLTEDFYDIDKTGTANIVRNAEKNTLTLITCRHNTNKQIVYICELVEKV